jgi:hypothetical protein
VRHDAGTVSGGFTVGTDTAKPEWLRWVTARLSRVTGSGWSWAAADWAGVGLCSGIKGWGTGRKRRAEKEGEWAASRCHESATNNYKA